LKNGVRSGKKKIAAPQAEFTDQRPKTLGSLFENVLPAGHNQGRRALPGSAKAEKGRSQIEHKAQQRWRLMANLWQKVVEHFDLTKSFDGRSIVRGYPDGATRRPVAFVRRVVEKRHLSRCCWVKLADQMKAKLGAIWISRYLIKTVQLHQLTQKT
jgi:hypothetical protein